MFKRIIALAIILYLGQCGGSGYANDCGNSCGGSFGVDLTQGRGGVGQVVNGALKGAQKGLIAGTALGAPTGKVLGHLLGQAIHPGGGFLGAKLGTIAGTAAGAAIGAVTGVFSGGFITLLSQVIKNWACSTGPVVGQGIVAAIGDGYIELINSTYRTIKFAQCSRRKFGSNRNNFVVGDTVQYNAFLDGSDCWAQTVRYIGQGGQQGQAVYTNIQQNPQNGLYNQYNQQHQMGAQQKIRQEKFQGGQINQAFRPNGQQLTNYFRDQSGTYNVGKANHQVVQQGGMKYEGQAGNLNGINIGMQPNIHGMPQNGVYYQAQSSGHNRMQSQSRTIVGYRTNSYCKTTVCF